MSLGSNLALIKFASLVLVFCSCFPFQAMAFPNNSWEQALVQENPYGLFSKDSPLLNAITPQDNAQNSPNSLAKELIEALKKRQLEMARENPQNPFPDKRQVVRETFSRWDELHNWLFQRNFFPEKEYPSKTEQISILEAMKNRALELAMPSSAGKAKQKANLANAVAVYEILGEGEMNLHLAGQLRKTKVQGWIPKDISIEEFKKQIANGQHQRLMKLKEAENISNTKLYDEKHTKDKSKSSLKDSNKNLNEKNKSNTNKHLNGKKNKNDLQKGKLSKEPKSSHCTDIVILFVVVVVLIGGTVGIFQFLKYYKSKKEKEGAKEEA